MDKYDCKPTLNDQQVMDFCRNGYLVLPSAVPDEVNRRAIEFMAEHPDSTEPVEILKEDWFDEGVIKNPQAAGAVRSLLGRDYLLPNLISSHRTVGPTPPQDWHPDAGSIITDRLDYLQVVLLSERRNQGDGADRDRAGLAPEPRSVPDARANQKSQDLEADDLASRVHIPDGLLGGAPQEQLHLLGRPRQPEIQLLANRGAQSRLGLRPGLQLLLAEQHGAPPVWRRSGQDVRVALRRGLGAHGWAVVARFHPHRPGGRPDGSADRAAT